MDKSHTLYSGILIYRTQRDITEFLLSNDTFSNKKHWTPPKGQVIGKEGELKCALRELFELTGLRPSDLKIREEFAANLTYLSGTKPKKVQYHLAQVINPQVRLPNTQGINLQWCTLAVGIEKCNFKTMQQLLAAANKYVNENPCPATPVETTKPAVPPPPKVESNPLYKTRLCERYETEGACSYGSRCNFAHGITELRGKVVEEVEVKEIKEEEVDDNENMLFKTKLCERFMRDQFCQYGPKCHFAHGEAELKTRPKKEENELPTNNNQRFRLEKKPSSPMMNNNNASDNNNGRSDSSWRSNSHENRSSSGNWRAQLDSVNNQLSQMSVRKENNYKYRGSESPVAGRADNEDSWRSKTPDTPGRAEANDVWRPKAANKPTEKESPNMLDDLRRPAFTDHQKKQNGKPTKAASSNNVTETEKSWMKIVKLTKEEQDELQIDNQNTNNTKTNKTNQNNGAGVSNQEENIIAELKKFFTTQKPIITNKGKIADDVKELTKMEMRNDLSKSQLLFILFASLLEDSDQAKATSGGTLSIFKSRNHIFKMHVKTEADQLLLLKAWEKFVKTRKTSMVSKTPAVLSYWYDVELVEEEVFVNWYNALEKDSPIEKKSAKFIEWLSTAEEEEEDDD